MNTSPASPSSGVKPIPEGYHSITPYLHVNNAAAALDFYQRAFAAEERFRIAESDGRIGHAELRIGDSMLMLSDEYPAMDVRGPLTLGGTPMILHLYVEDVDAVTARALAAGARLERPVETQFYGDRGGLVVDPFGHKWWISTHVEDVSPEELERRAGEAVR